MHAWIYQGSQDWVTDEAHATVSRFHPQNQITKASRPTQKKPLKMTMKKTILIATAMLFAVGGFHSPVLAAASCGGTITGVYTQHDGAVVIESSCRANCTKICNLKQEWKGIYSQTCWGWFSQANNRFTEDRTVAVSHANEAANACPTLPTCGHSPALYYFMVK